MKHTITQTFAITVYYVIFILQAGTYRALAGCDTTTAKSAGSVCFMGGCHFELCASDQSLCTA